MYEFSATGAHFILFPFGPRERFPDSCTILVPSSSRVLSDFRIIAVARIIDATIVTAVCDSLGPPRKYFTPTFSESISPRLS